MMLNLPIEIEAILPMMEGSKFHVLTDNEEAKRKRPLQINTETESEWNSRSGVVISMARRNHTHLAIGRL